MSDLEWNPDAAARLGRAIVHSAEEAALGSLNPDGSPHASHVACATLSDGSPVVLISNLALHTQNVKRDVRTSMLFVAERAGTADTSARARITVDGVLEPVADRDVVRARFLRRQPAAETYVDFADFSFMRLVPRSAHLVAGFGRIITLPGAAILAPEAAVAAELGAMDEGACRHMDEDHADAMALMATRLAGAPEGEWRAVGVDPLGMDLGLGGQVVRVEFPKPLTTGGELRVALKRLVDEARAAA